MGSASHHCLNARQKFIVNFPRFGPGWTRGPRSKPAKSKSSGSSRCEGRAFISARNILLPPPGMVRFPAIQERLHLLALQPVLAAAEIAGNDRVVHRPANFSQSASATWASGR